MILLMYPLAQLETLLSLYDSGCLKRAISLQASRKLEHFIETYPLVFVNSITPKICSIFVRYSFLPLAGKEQNSVNAAGSSLCGLL